MYRKNQSGQFLGFQGVDATTGGIKSGVTWTIRRCIDGTFAAATGTVTEDGTAGWYKFAISQADINGNNIQYNFTGTGAVPQTVNIITDGSPPDVNLKNAAGTAVTLDSNNVLNVSTKYLAGTALTARDIGASVLLSTGTGTGQLDFTSGVVKANATQWLGGTIPAVNVTGVPLVDLKYTLGTISPATAGSVRADAVTGAVGSVTGAVGSVTAGVTVTTNNDKTGYALTQTFPTNFSALGISAGGHISNVDTLTTYTGNTPQTGDAYARLGAPAGASVSADVAAVKSDTGTILTDVNLGAGAIYSRLGAPAGASIAADIAAVKSDIDAGVTLSSSALDAIWAYAVDGTRSALGLMRGFAAALLGKASGLATTSAVFRDTNDTKDRITATVDVDGNRSSVTLDLT